MNDIIDSDMKTTICCGKVSAKVGAIVTGVLSIILTVLYTLDFGAEAAGFLDEDYKQEGHVVTDTFKYVSGFSCGLCCLALIFSCLVIFGTVTKRPKLLIPWMIIVIISIVYFTVIAILETTLHMSLINVQGTITLVDEIISLIAFIAVVVGGLYVIKLEYSTLRGDE